MNTRKQHPVDQANKAVKATYSSQTATSAAILSSSLGDWPTLGQAESIKTNNNNSLNSSPLASVVSASATAPGPSSLNSTSIATINSSPGSSSSSSVGAFNSVAASGTLASSNTTNIISSHVGTHLSDQASTDSVVAAPAIVNCWKISPTTSTNHVAQPGHLIESGSNTASDCDGIVEDVVDNVVNAISTLRLVGGEQCSNQCQVTTSSTGQELEPAIANKLSSSDLEGSNSTKQNMVNLPGSKSGHNVADGHESEHSNSSCNKELTKSQLKDGSNNSTTGTLSSLPSPAAGGEQQPRLSQQQQSSDWEATSNNNTASEEEKVEDSVAGTNSSGSKAASAAAAAGKRKGHKKPNWRPLEIPVPSSKPSTEGHRGRGGPRKSHRDDGERIPGGRRRENGDYHSSSHPSHGYSSEGGGEGGTGSGGGASRGKYESQRSIPGDGSKRWIDKTRLPGRGRGRGGRMANGPSWRGRREGLDPMGSGRVTPTGPYDDYPTDIHYYVDFQPITDPTITPTKVPLLSPVSVSTGPGGAPVTNLFNTVVAGGPLQPELDLTTGNLIATSSKDGLVTSATVLVPNGLPVTAPASVPFVAPFFAPPAAFGPLALPSYDAVSLQKMIRGQIEYYFSEANLQGDIFIRRKMDAEGYLPITLICSFHRVQNLTQDVAMVIKALEGSTLVELSENHLKARPRSNPEQWPIIEPTAQQLLSGSSNNIILSNNDSSSSTSNNSNITTSTTSSNNTLSSSNSNSNNNNNTGEEN